jgi:hypothetical protein
MAATVVALPAVTWTGALGAGPASAPASSTTRPQDPSVALRDWVADLADADPEVREHARRALMGLDRSTLEQLRQVVAEARPLGPSQAAGLQEVVNHVYLAGEPEDAAGTAGFLGVQLAPVAVEVAPGPGVRAEGMPVGVAIAGRVPGFCGYRMLEDGDVILRLTAEKANDFRTPADLSRVVGEQQPGRTVTLDVMRRGKLIQVPITLDRRPAWVGQLVPAEAVAPRERRAAEYWDRTFGPLVEARGS